MKDCPYFSNWGRANLAKLYLFFKKVKYRAGQHVYMKGDECSHIYIVLNGEFEQTVKTLIKPQDEFNHSQYLLQGWDQGINKDAPNKSKKIKNKGQQVQFKCCLIGPGQIIGEEDAIKMLNHSKTVRCKS